jgi:hypothetical protein
MQSGTQQNVRDVKRLTNGWESFVLSAMCATISTDDYPSAFLGQGGYPFRVQSCGPKFAKEMRNLSISTVELQRIAYLSLDYGLTEALVKKETNRLCHAAFGLR